MTNQKNSSTKQKNICPKCSYEYNELTAKSCAICQTILTSPSETQIFRKTHAHNLEHSVKKIRASSNFKIGSLIKKIDIRSSLLEIQKPINLLGLFFVGMGLMLWANYLFVDRSQSKVSDIPTEEVSSLEVPQGLFSYGGAPIFAPIVASGINGLIETEYPGYELRYTKPLNQDYSSSNGIRMLINGELSFAYNERPLTDQEYRISKLRNINLKQIPIALDGVVIYGNTKTPVKQLNREQVLKIFLGEIDNWNDINPQIEDLPIVPVVVKNEDLQLLGIKQSNQQISDATEYTANYTQAIRKVIGTEGSISFASASIVKNQGLIKLFELADGGSQNYVSPVVHEQLNIADFKSGKYPLTRRIFLVFREDETIDQQASMAYLDYLIKEEGQKKIEESGLVPLH